MPVSALSAPAHLCIFVHDPDTGHPTLRLPLYAEVAVPRTVPKLPASERWREPVRAALQEVDPQAAADTAVRGRVEAAALAAFAGVLDEPSRQRLIGDPGLARGLAGQAFKHALEAARSEHFAAVPAATLDKLLAAAVRALAPEFELGVVPEVDDAGDVWSFPLGVLTTDHVGYCSFDLKRLRPDVQLLLAEAIEARRNDPQARSRLAIWISSYGHPGRIDALAQARFASDAVVARLALKWNTLPASLINMGPRALQNPGLTDWRLSPASFAASPKTLVGENGCEELVPANLALQEFVLRQVVRLNQAPDTFELPEGFKAAYVDDYKVSWFSLGHSLGEILYSLPLAPGETVRLAVIDWSWDSRTQRDESTRLTEEILHQTHRDRTISETVKAGLKEIQHGSSFMGGMASATGASGGANLGVVGLGAAAGNTWSLGGSTATSEGSRELAAENVQRLNDSFSQASSAQREINSTVVIQARQEENESIQTRTFSNYNHSHTLTVMYYEVLRHYRVTVQWVRRREAVLVKLGSRLPGVLSAAVLLGRRYMLEPLLLDPRLGAAFDAAARVALGEEKLKRDTNKWAGSSQTIDPGAKVFTQLIAQFTTNDDDTSEPVFVVLHLHDGRVFEFQCDGAGDEGTSPEFVKALPVALAWKEIKGVEVKLKDINDGGDWTVTNILITMLTAANERTNILADAAQHELDDDGGSTGLMLSTQPPPPTTSTVGPKPQRVDYVAAEDDLALNALMSHLELNRSYYDGVLQLANNPNNIAVEFEGRPWTAGQVMADHVDPAPLDMFGSYVAFGLARQSARVDDSFVVDVAAALNGDDPARRQAALDRLAALDDADRQFVLGRLPLASAVSERLLSMSTRGVFAEGKLGHCNVSEEIDNTRFWKWDEHPLPIEAPEIAAVQPVQPSPQAVGATPSAFPQALVNIVSPTPAPDPAGLGAALALLGTPGIFRDMSGRQEVADLLKKLSDNSIAIAEAANRAREIQAKYGTDLDKQDKDLELGRTQADAEVAKEIVRQRAAQAEKVSPSQAQDAIKLSEAEKNKGNKTPEEHRQYSQQVQQNVQGAKPTRKSRASIKFNVDLKGYGNNLLIGRFGIDVKQRGTAVGFLMATDYSRQGQLEVGVTNEFDDPRYQVEISGEVLGGVGINAQLRGRDVVQIPREDFDAYDYFYLIATAEVGEFDFETTRSDEIAHEVAKKIGGGVDAEFAMKATITAKTEGGIEWKDGQTHTSATAVKLKIVYYKGGFTVAYVKKP
ncbi:hypothetical protein [Rubrivivax gelatinosus]|uniref:hypothetical protein n=1 Tax=Rubrivivax gelatinosus TaxID=28068 RepID=UPI0019044C77|nr:hypothetical protein [Rubrivivax gelatinosus]